MEYFNINNSTSYVVISLNYSWIVIIGHNYAYCDNEMRSNDMQTVFNQYHLFPKCWNDNSTFQITF